jgi:flagellar biogenesis protein FliO
MYITSILNLAWTLLSIGAILGLFLCFNWILNQFEKLMAKINGDD